MMRTMEQVIYGDTGTIPTFSVIANRSSVPEGEFVIYTVTTTNVESGSIFITLYLVLESHHLIL